MIAAPPGPIEGAIRALIGLARNLGTRAFKRKPEVIEAPVWQPQTDMERAVYAALIVAGKPVTNDELARLMRVSKGHASKCVSALDGRVSKVRVGREVRIAMH